MKITKGEGSPVLFFYVLPRGGWQSALIEEVYKLDDPVLPWVARILGLFRRQIGLQVGEPFIA
jgi:hypothetical protein